jgi:peptidoglycan/xylan/chitin deacetylase (PgdA/CDA1 family)
MIKLARTLSRIRELAAASLKQLLYTSQVSVNYVKRHHVNFIVTFHAVSREEASSFEGIVRYLARNFKVVSLGELVVQIEGKAATREDGLVALTFDDGLRNHAEVVYPILKKLGMPAAFYICPKLIDRGCSVWTWEMKSRLDRMEESVRQRFLDLAEATGGTQAVVNWMKTIPVVRREAIEREIRDNSQGFAFTPDERDRFELMTWQQVKDLDPSLITICSHTATHIDLPQADSARLESELAESKEIIESRLGRKVEFLAYPNGSISPQMLPTVARYYRSAVVTRTGVVKRGDNLLSLKRIHADLDIAKFSWNLTVMARRKARS